MSGPMASSRIAPAMVASTRMRRVHPRMSGDPCRLQVQGDRCDRRSVRPVHPAGAFPLTSGPTTDRSSSPRRCRTGSRLSVPRPPTSSEAAPGRTGTSRASTLACATSCSTVYHSQALLYKFRPASRCERSPTEKPDTGIYASVGGDRSLARPFFCGRRSKARYAINGGIRLSDAMGRPLHAPNHELPNEASPVTF